MNKMKVYLFCIMSAAVVVAQAKNNDPNTYALMTMQDMQNNAVSNVTITNGTGQNIPAATLFISNYDAISPTDGDCSICTGGITGGGNLGGVVLSPVTFNPSQVLPIGQNYLYNMIYNGIYFIKTTAGSSACALPGCSWPGDTPQRWCLDINIISRHSSYTYSTYTSGSNPPANTPAYGAAGDSPPDQFNYKYSLINPALQGVGNACIGPITCNDKTLTCTVSTAQNETFRPY